MFIAAALVGVVAWKSLAEPSNDITVPSTTVFDRDINFPEGYTVAQMAERVAERRPPIDARSFVAAAEALPAAPIFARPPGETSSEGLLFPATYSVGEDDEPGSIVQSLASAMENVVREEGIAAGATALGLTPYEVLTVASMIEKEAKLDIDRPLIARVIYNRLALGMELQIDATLYYGNDTATPFSELREIDTPFNTYLNSGLPPTPIANPGQASIRAALNPSDNPPADDPVCADLPDPEECDYLFYVLADDDGAHVFAPTYDQHLVNIEAARAAGVL